MADDDIASGGDFGNGGPSGAPSDALSFDSCAEARRAAIDYLAKGRKRPIPAMSPMDEMRWFQPPKWTTVTVGTSTPESLCVGDPQRILLNIQADGALRICTDKSHLTDGGGFRFVAGQVCTYEALQKHEAILCQTEWFGISDGGSIDVEVLELCLKDWPTESTNGDEMLRRVSQRIQRGESTLNGSNGSSGDF